MELFITRLPGARRPAPPWARYLRPVWRDMSYSRASGAAGRTSASVAAQ